MITFFNEIYAETNSRKLSYIQILWLIFRFARGKKGAFSSLLRYHNKMHKLHGSRRSVQFHFFFRYRISCSFAFIKLVLWSIVMFLYSVTLCDGFTLTMADTHFFLEILMIFSSFVSMFFIREIDQLDEK